MLLAIVPALALLFAIGRGFGFQNILTTQLFGYFPSQQKALEAAFRFVDAYLAQASEGIFVGVGILFLLWTLISLVSSVEDAFNKIWGVKYGRSLWRKITDYTAIFLILPVLMICSSGLSIFMSTTLQEAVPLKFMSPAISVILDCATIVLTWLFFTGVYMLIPNTTVKFKNALMSGILAGVAFQVLQWLFVTGQLYVSKYNAIYGGFAFLPLLLIWMQLVWVICLSGAVLCYSSQNIFRFSFTSEVTDISALYRRKITLAIMAVVAKRFKMGLQPLQRRRLRGGLQYTHPACRGDSGRTCRSRTPVESGDRQQREQLRPAAGDRHNRTDSRPRGRGYRKSRSFGFHT